ncbi:MAG: DUF393 domain-containing protein [Planctomycetes bacterium]|nr:DUF393 domain-containing protein [Planctomycetota bacterium]
MNQPALQQTEEFDIEVFFDGDCPLCRREISLLRRWDRRQRIRATDISDPEFDPVREGKSFEELMARIHGRLPDGTWIEGVEVFRRLYTAVGWGPLVAVTRWPVISRLCDWGYTWFARKRLALTGRCTAETCGLNSRSMSGGSRGE